MATVDFEDAIATLRQVAIAYDTKKLSTRPDPAAIVESMTTLERGRRGERRELSLDDVLGDWRLIFVTGTQKTRKKAGTMIGAGRYLPGLVNITISYRADDTVNAGENTAKDAEQNTGRVVNQVKLGGLTFTVTGPIEAIAGRQTLAFDFTQWCVGLGSWMPFNGELGNGADGDVTFTERSLKDRPFFNYFWTDERAIAARGKGGGLALWIRT
ncbi:MAG: hypothetical protein AAF685_10335 [Cyanobacteria bacterium P01_C01_bin.89]